VDCLKLDAATQEQRNRLAKQLFEEMVIQDKDVTKVKPCPELAGFFALDYAQRVSMYCTGGPDGVPCRGFDTSVDLVSAEEAPHVPAYFPVRDTLAKRSLSSAERRYRLPPELWPEIQQRAKRRSLRQLAAAYGVSHEAIRRIVNLKSTKPPMSRRHSA
jgi:hypothetical protein